MKLHTVELSGRFVQLIPLQKQHVAALHAAGRDAEIWTYFFQQPDTLQKMQSFVDDALNEQERGNELPFAIVEKTSRDIVGSTRLLGYLPSHRSVEIGATWLSPTAWNTAINAECKLLLLRHCFETLNLLRVQFTTDERNVRSQRAIEKLGAHREGVMRCHRVLAHNGFVRNSVLYSIVRDEWPSVQARLETRLEPR